MTTDSRILSLADASQFHRYRKYFTYIVIFPNGVEWCRQEPLIHDLEWHLKRLGAEHKKDWDWRHYLNDVFRKHEAQWVDKMGIKHILKLEDKKRDRNWGSNDTGLSTFKHGLQG